MKSGREAILICGPGSWRIGVSADGGTAWTDTGISPHPDAAEISQKLPAALDRAGCRGRDLVLALPSGDCLAASIATHTLPRADRRRAMEYRLEGKLPLAIEEVSADFIRHNGRALGVCVRSETVNAMSKAIRDCGVGIAAVCPAAILGFQAASPAADADGLPDAIIWRGGEGGESADILLLEDGELVQWHWIPATAPDMNFILASNAMERGRPLRLALRGGDASWSAQIGGLPNVQIIADDAISMDEAAFQTAARILTDQAEPLLSFGHEASGVMPLRRPILAALAAGLLLCLALIGGAVWRANRYANLAAQFDDQEQRLFQQLFPGEAVPLGVESRLLSYAGHLQTDSAGPAPQPASSLTLLYNILADLPAGGQFQFDELQFDSGRATLHGRAGSLAEADEIAAALRKSKTLSVDDPQTQQLADGGVGFTISARERGLP